MNSHLVVTAYATLWTTLCALMPLFVASRLRQRRSVDWGYFAWGATIAALAFAFRRPAIHSLFAQEWIVRAAITAHLRTPLLERAALRALLATLNSLMSAGSLVAGCWGISRNAQDRWARAMMYGLGFGWAHLLLGTPLTHPGDWVLTLAHISAWSMSRWIWDAGCDLTTDVAVSVLAFQGYQRRRALWFGCAIMLAVTGAVVPILAGSCLTDFSGYLRFLVSATIHTTLGLASLWVIVRWRDPAATPTVADSRQSM
jgi:hypothetical protein